MTVERSPSRPQRSAVRAISWYQRAVEGRPSPCRFFPSCSAYAAEALTVHGTRRGLFLTIRRLVRCRPFGPSGFDPVPEPRPAPGLADPQRPTVARGTCVPMNCEDC